MGAARRAARGAAEHRRSRCCCAAATPSATRRTRPRSPTRSCARPRPPASTSSASSTRSTTSTRCARRSTRCSRPAPPSPRSRSATRATCSTPPRTSTRSTTTCGLAERDRRRRRAHPRDQGHGGPAAAGRGREARRRPARALRPAGARAHARHRGRPARDAARGEPRGRRRGRRRERADGRHHEPAVGCRRSSPRSRTPSATPGIVLQAVSDLEPYWEAVRTRLHSRSSRACRARPAACTTTRSRAASSRTCASRRSRSASATDFELIEDMYAAANRILGRVAEGDAVVEGRRRPRPAPRGGRRPTPPTSRRTPRSTTSRTRSSASWRASSATCPAAGPSRSAPRCSRAATCKIGVAELDRRRARRARGRRRRRAARRSTGCCSPRPTQAVRADPRAVRRPVGRSTPPTTCTGCRQGAEHVVEIDTGVQPVRRARGDRRGRRQGHAHRHDDPQRPAAPGVRARSQHHRRDARRPRRRMPRRPGQVAAPFSGVVTLKVGRGRHRRRPAARSRRSRR